MIIVMVTFHLVNRFTYDPLLKEVAPRTAEDVHYDHFHMASIPLGLKKILSNKSDFVKDELPCRVL